MNNEKRTYEFFDFSNVRDIFLGLLNESSCDTPPLPPSTNDCILFGLLSFLQFGEMIMSKVA